MSVALTINDKEVKVKEGITVLEAAQEAGFHIPNLCYHPALSNFGACRLCIVEIEGMGNLPASCVTAVSEGMIIKTESKAVVDARKTILELLLANHPNDCLTCQKSGDCRLQDYSYLYGIKEISFEGEMHDHSLDDSNPYIFRDNNKCILCGKCVRACAEIKGEYVLEFTGRGFNTKITPPFDYDFKESSCVYCHNCVAVCPVGALIDKNLLGKGRMWELQERAVSCGLCENACSFDLQIKDGKVLGAAARAGTPERFGQPCLQGRLSVNFKHNPELSELPLIKKNGEFEPVPWEEALGIEDIVDKIRKLDNIKSS